MTFFYYQRGIKQKALIKSFGKCILKMKIYVMGQDKFAKIWMILVMMDLNFQEGMENLQKTKAQLHMHLGKDKYLYKHHVIPHLKKFKLYNKDKLKVSNKQNNILMYQQFKNICQKLMEIKQHYKYIILDIIHGIVHKCQTLKYLPQKCQTHTSTHNIMFKWGNNNMSMSILMLLTGQKKINKFLIINTV